MPKRLPVRLERRHIEAIVTIARCGSIHGAARQLGLAQPLVTNLLHDCERILGMPLFARSHKGCVILADAQGILSSAIYAFKALGSLDGATTAIETPLKLGCIPRVTYTLMPALLREVAMRPGSAAVELTEGTATELNTALGEGQLDCVIARQPVVTQRTPDKLQIDNLYEERTVLVAGPTHPLAGKATVRLKDLLEYPWILPKTRSYSRDILLQLFAREGLTVPRPFIESLSFLSNLQLASKTQCISIAPSRAAHEFQKAGLIKIIRTNLDLGSYMIVIMYHVTVLARPGFREFLAAVKRGVTALESKW